MSTSTRQRPLGAPPAPRRRFIPPPAVRLAQVALVFRIGALLGLLLVAGLAAAPRVLDVSASLRVQLPGGTTWTALAPWIVAGSAFEAILVLRLGSLGSVSRRIILLVEAAVIAGSGLYAATGVKAMLVVLVASIASVVMLRLDHVRHSFNRAAAARGLTGRRRVVPVLFDGYSMPDPTAPKAQQLIGYRAGVDIPDAVTPERSRA